MVLGKRNVEGGGRQSDITHESFRTVLGLRGDINDTWSYDVYGQYGESQLALTFLNDFSIQRTSRAVDVQIDRRVNANGTPVNAATFGTPQCVAFLDGTDPACVPYNPWAPGAITQDQLNYLQIPLVQRGTTTERIVNASFTGDLANYGMKLPTAQTGLLVNVGVEWREEKSELLPDAAFQSGDGAGQGGPTPPIAGGYIAKDLFAEARMALIEDAPFAESVSAEAGYRYSDYSLDFSTDTYKLGLEWTPVQDIRARASYQRAVRVPNVAELYGAQTVGLDGTIDVCAGSAPTLTFDAVRAYRRDGRAVRTHRGESGRAVQRLRRRQSGSAAGDGGYHLVRPRVPAELRAGAALADRLLRHLDRGCDPGAECRLLAADVRAQRRSVDVQPRAA